MTVDRNDIDQTQTVVLIQPGSRFSHYQIISRIGSGGMGDVYLAQDSILNRKVVLKCLPAHLSVDETFRSRFMREARTAASLNHHNIITIYEIERFNDRLYIAMEYIVGESLRELLARENPNPNEASEIVIQICYGLKKAHDNNIVHRDIKPDNIMISRDGIAKVLDFGLAKFKEDTNITRAGTTIGTAAYMSPEQGRGQEVDRRSDIFSVGIVFYEMLTGRTAFRRENIPATIYAIAHEELPLLNESGNDQITKFQPIFDRALDKDMDQRYQTIDEMIDDLNAIRGDSHAQPIYRTPAPSTTPKVKSLAVLCLTNLGSVKDDFLCYGISEDLIVDLTRLGTLRVAPMRAVKDFHNSDIELSEIATKLDVDFILDGSLKRVGSSLKISAQLIEAQSQKNLWADRWEINKVDLPSIKMSLAESIDRVLGVRYKTGNRSGNIVNQISNAAAYELYLRGKYTFDHKKDTTDVEVALGLFTEALTEEPNLLIARTGVAQILVYKGEYKRAFSYIGSALAKAKADDKKEDAFRLLLVTAEAQIHLSLWNEGNKSLNHALTIVVEMGDMAGELEALRLLIDINTRRAEFYQALLRFERVMEIVRHLDDKDMVAESLKSIANVHLRRGEYSRARTLYEEAIVIAKRRDNVLLEAKCICNIGLTHSNTGNLDEAQICFENALRMYIQVGDQTGQSNAYNNLALIYATRGPRRKAIEFGKKAAEILKTLGDRASYSLAISNVARYQATLGQYDSAIATATEALKIAKELDYPFVRYLAKDSLGYCHFCRNEMLQAIECYTLALDVAQKADLRRETALALAGLGEVYYYLNELDKCVQFCQQAIDLAHEIKNRVALIRAVSYHSAAQVLNGDHYTGLNGLNEMLNESREYGDSRFIIMCLRLLAQMTIYVDKSDVAISDARVFLNEAIKLAQKSEIAYEIELCTRAKEHLK